MDLRIDGAQWAGIEEGVRCLGLPRLTTPPLYRAAEGPTQNCNGQGESDCLIKT